MHGVWYPSSLFTHSNTQFRSVTLLSAYSSSLRWESINTHLSVTSLIPPTSRDYNRSSKATFNFDKPEVENEQHFVSNNLTWLFHSTYRSHCYHGIQNSARRLV